MAALGKGKPFYTADAAFILSFSTIMLNTDLHSSRIPAHKKMKKEEFIANNRGINEGEDLPVAYLSALYDGIRDNQITLEAEVNHSLGSGGTLNSSSAAASILDADVASWNQLILKRGRSMVPALFTSRATSHSSALSASSSFSSSFSYEHERDMFQVISQEVWHTLIASLLSFNNISSSYSAPDRLLLFQKTITGVNDFFSVAFSLHVIDVLNKSFQSLVSTLTNLLSSREENDQMPPATSTDLNYYNTSMMERLQMVLQQRTMIQWKELTIRVSAADGTTTLSSDLLLLFSECVLQLVCEVFALCINTLDSASLRQFFHLLLWCRRRGALPDALLKSTQHSQEDEDSITISVFGHHCYSHARGYSIHRHISSSSASSSSSSPASVWSRVNSLFFDTSGPYPSSASSFHALVSSESIINTCSVHLETHLPFFLPRQRLLRTALEHSSLTSTLFSLSTSSSCSALPSVLQSLLAVLTEGLHHLTSNSAAAASSSLAEGLEASSLCLFQEIDAVAILCWIKRLMDINTSHHWFVICWPPIQGGAINNSLCILKSLC